MANRVVWFDVPVKDLNRAIGFYSKVLSVDVSEKFPGVAVIEHAGSDVSGCLFHSDDAKPSDAGVLLYFNVDWRLDAALETAKASGGKILKEKEQIGEYGYRAIVLDSEGNRIALHSA